jgi:two-component system, NarL family, response regulator YdfI
MAEGVIRVLVATASEATRSWFSALHAGADGISIVGIVARDPDLRDHVQALAPDVLVMDATDASLLASIRELVVEIIVLLDADSWHAAPSALLRAGVKGVIPPQPSLEELEATARAVMAGFVVLEPRTVDGGIPAPVTAALDRSPLALQPLTPREIEVLGALAEGYGNKQIAARLDISEHTVKTHLAAIFEKLDVSNRTEAVLAGARLGLVLL